ncbi:MAG: hypothetical protein ACYC9O_18485, partial [Candidatus Latescibacterota bacterium]
PQDIMPGETPSRALSLVLIPRAWRKAHPLSLDLIGNLSDLFAGRPVALKPNDTWASSADLTACTRGDTARADIR